MSDQEIIALARGDQERAAKAGEQLYGGIADAMSVFRYRAYKWMEARARIRPIHELTDRYESNPSLARELAGLSLARSSMTNLMHIAGLLRAGMVFPVVSIFRVIDELYIDGIFIRLDPSGMSAIKMLDWQLYETVKINKDNPVLQNQLVAMGAKYRDDRNFGKPGGWAQLPDGKRYHNFEVRKRYVLKQLENDTPPEILGPDFWQFITEEISTQRAQTNTTVHASPIAVSTVDDYALMAVQAGLYAAMTVATYRRISDDEMVRNFVMSSASPEPHFFGDDENAWQQVNRATVSLVQQIRHMTENSNPVS